MHVRFYVYDIRGQLEDYVASFASRDDADAFGKMKFGEHAYVTDVPHHEKIKLGFARKRKK